MNDATTLTLNNKNNKHTTTKQKQTRGEGGGAGRRGGGAPQEQDRTLITRVVFPRVQIMMFTVDLLHRSSEPQPQQQTTINNKQRRHQQLELQQPQQHKHYLQGQKKTLEGSPRGFDTSEGLSET